MSLAVVLAAHRPADADEAGDLETLRSLVAGESSPWSRSLPLHLTASALVVHPPTSRVLLRWHHKQQLWLQVGGHADVGEDDPWPIALRETVEETRLDDVRPWPGPEPTLAQVAIVPVNAVGDEPAHRHGDLRYLLTTDRPDAVPPEVEGVPLRWMTVADAHTVADTGLGKLLDLAASTF
jgi:8-oxo-dGTP pyrophosphatase MutT (NUDIX family)